MLFDVWKSISEDAETVLPESGEAPKSPGVSDVSALQSVPNEAGLIMLPHSSEAGTLADNDNGTVCANKNSSLLSGFDDIQQSFSQTDLNVSLSCLFPVSPLPEQLIGDGIISPSSANVSPGLVTVPTFDPNAPTTSKTIITITPPKSKSIFQDVVRYPERKVSKSSRKKEEVPTVITSDKWVEYHSLKEQIKQEKER